MAARRVKRPAVRNGFNTVPPLAVAEQMGIAERVEKGFQMSLSSGVDVLCSLSSVLVKMGEHFTEKAGSGRHSLAYLHPATLLRLARAYIRSRLEKRPILPKDLWQVKALISWGLDTSLYRQKIEHYWGITPYEFHACTEAGVLALQGWNKRGLTPAPLVAFFEFIPEEESVRSRQLAGYHPDTVLLSELEAGKRYELVITSFHGMPFIRYRVGHLIKVLSLNDPETGASLPQLAFVGRSDDVIDLAGFTRLDEKTLSEAIYQSQLLSLDWIAAKEYNDGRAVIHLYIEAKGDWEEAEVLRRVHQNLKCLDPAYRDVESMLGLTPLQVSLLAPGTFQRYYHERQRLGEDEIQARLPRINPPPAAIRELIRINNDTITEVACFSTDLSPSLP